MEVMKKEKFEIFQSGEDISQDAEKLSHFLEMYQNFYNNRFENPSRHSDLIKTDFKWEASGTKVIIEVKGGLSIPPELLRPIKQLLDYLSAGKTVTLFPKDKMLTTQEVADLLSCSRQHVVNLCKDGKLECDEIGSHKRISVQSLLAYKNLRNSEKRNSLMKMTNLGQEIESEIEPKVK